MSKSKKKKLSETIIKEINDYGEETFKVGDEEIKFEVETSHKKALQKTLLNADSFFRDRYVNEKGDVDLKAMKSDMLKLLAFEDIVQSLSGQARAQGGKKVAKELKNQKAPKREGTTDSGKPKTVSEAIGQHFMQKV